MLMNECHALESNNTYARWESMVNLPTIIGSFCKISSASVKLTCPEWLTGTLFVIIVLLTRQELAKGWLVLWTLLSIVALLATLETSTWLVPLFLMR